MDLVITYDTVKVLIANPPSIGKRPNFFNLRNLRNFYVPTLKCIPCPQSAINGWAGAILTVDMYSFIDSNVFVCNEMDLTTQIPDFPPILAADGFTVIPYTRENGPDHHR
jgi:hypothetical protein